MTVKKRLRKKFYTGEFKELGIEVLLNFKDGLSDDDLDSFVGDLVNEVLAENRLDFEGTGDKTQLAGLIVLDRRGSVTREQREAVDAWLEKREDLASYEVSELLDAWYA